MEAGPEQQPLPERPSKYQQIQDKVPEQFIDMLRDKKAKETVIKAEREKEVRSSSPSFYTHNRKDV